MNKHNLLGLVLLTAFVTTPLWSMSEEEQELQLAMRASLESQEQEQQARIRARHAAIHNAPQQAAGAAASSSAAAASSGAITNRCEVCKEEQIDFHALSCGDRYCVNCLKGLVHSAIAEKSTTPLRCPQVDCRKPIANEVATLVTPEERKCLADIQAREWLRSQSAKQCPTPDCPYAFIAGCNQRENIECPSCKQSYCCNCLES
ncbi:MAG TPA: E3 ubiquitin protein ligase, partial [Gammaproteobacteria bacterium]|nr:E3 ubiquitin protein ligase [Gammaproteobacteria bacterium]